MRTVVGLDLRSLGLWRIALGTVLVLDWLARSFHLRAHYTDQGILPLRAHLNQPNLTDRFWSVFYLNDSVWFVAVLFVLGGLSAICLTLGYRTAWSGWLAWILLIGVQNRNPLVLTKGDSYLLLLLFWGNFLPWGRAFSLDYAGQAEEAELSRPVVSIPAVCYLAQVCLLYWFTALLRTHPAWQVDGTALYLSYNLEPLAKEPAYMMLGLGPGWLSFFTSAALLMELLGPFLLLVPGAWVRILGVALIMLFHLGIYVTLEVFNFAWICLIGPIGLLPALFWQLAPGLALQRYLTQAAIRLRDRLPARLADLTLPPPGRPLVLLGKLVPPVALLSACLYLWFDLKGLYGNAPFMGAIRASGVSQSWGMFSPAPPSQHGWHSVRARRQSGGELDLITGKLYPQKGEYEGENSWQDQRWGIYRSMIQGSVSFESLARAYLSYLVAEWDSRHPEDPIVEADYLWHSRRTPPDYLLPQYIPEIKAQYRR